MIFAMARIMCQIRERQNCSEDSGTVSVLDPDEAAVARQHRLVDKKNWIFIVYLVFVDLAHGARESSFEIRLLHLPSYRSTHLNMSVCCEMGGSYLD